MNEIYLAKSNYTDEVKFFEDFSDLQEFSMEKKYEYNYYSIPIYKEFMDADLFLNNGEDPSDYL